MVNGLLIASSVLVALLGLPGPALAVLVVGVGVVLWITRKR